MNHLLKTSADEVRRNTAAHILDAAERTFRYFGYGKTTVTDIADDLGMSTANIYWFFASKAAIHQAVCARILERCYEHAFDACHRSASAEDGVRRSEEHKYELQ